MVILLQKFWFSGVKGETAPPASEFKILDPVGSSTSMIGKKNNANV